MSQSLDPLRLLRAANAKGRTSVAVALGRLKANLPAYALPDVVDALKRVTGPRFSSYVAGYRRVGQDVYSGVLLTRADFQRELVWAVECILCNQRFVRQFIVAKEEIEFEYLRGSASGARAALEEHAPRLGC